MIYVVFLPEEVVYNSTCILNLIINNGFFFSFTTKNSSLSAKTKLSSYTFLVIDSIYLHAEAHSFKLGMQSFLPLPLSAIQQQPFSQIIVVVLTCWAAKPHPVQ